MTIRGATQESTGRSTPVLTALKGAALCAVLTLLVVSGLQASGWGAAPLAPSGSAPAAEILRHPPALERTMRSLGCRGAGFAQDAAPRSALVRQDGQLRHVDVDQAWRVFTGETPGRLVATCLGAR